VKVIYGLSENKAVSFLSEIIALERGMPLEVAKQVRTAAALHDIGKLKIPDSILNKPGALDKSEFEVIKTHTVLGAGMLSSIQGEMGEIARAVCLYHHEWHDGSKSYWGHRASNLPSYIQIVSISDVFTALMSKRSYKEAWPPSKALAFIQEQSGTQFEPELVAVLLSLINRDSRIPAIFTEGVTKIDRS